MEEYPEHDQYEESHSEEIPHVRVPVSAIFPQDSPYKINRFIAERQQLNDLQPNTTASLDGPKLKISAKLGPAFNKAEPHDSDFKDLELLLVSIDGNKVVLAGTVRGKNLSPEFGHLADFFFIADPDLTEQDVEILVCEPSNRNRLVEELVDSL